MQRPAPVVALVPPSEFTPPFYDVTRLFQFHPPDLLAPLTVTSHVPETWSVQMMLTFVRAFSSICTVQVYENSTIVFGCGGLSLNIAAHRIRGVGGRERGREDSGKGI